MQDLIAKAQVNILPSFNCTGVKLKLLNALYNGRHCIVNREMVSGTGLEGICHITEGAADMRSTVAELYTRPIQQEEISQRREVLSGLYNKAENVYRLLQSIWTDEPPSPAPLTRYRS
jgi:hypothetical protein